MNWHNIADITATQPARRATMPIPTTEYIFNSARDQISHLVVELTFADFGNSVTICGIEATSADMFPEYDLCTDCTGKDTD